ncbi:MAG: M23 family metallopeptidase [Alphaproteobacteria bacterium]|nr:M23 family metallopeptidase [Alphaproteobacteria bacterium]MCD8520531.1 M23 family metallopeptidase [Alphaproteobacteria bacterium]MCD8570627.1 M23 family metallopeptidase [Alphaproteobacteria bacterium]
MKIRILLALGLLWTANAYAAEPPRFLLPLDCVMGETCWAANYVDMDPKPDSVRDFTCGPRSFEAHQGTDFAVRSRAEMHKGVNVLAALDGTVLRVRDGETDTEKAPADLEKIHAENKDCGNGVYVDHAKAGFKGLTTLYCHMKQGSVKVKAGDAVKAGDVLGQVGQSGFAEFPHVHFSIIWEGAVVDPFTGVNSSDGCGGFKRKLWKDAGMTYTPISIYDGGFRAAPPDFEVIKAGDSAPKTLSPASEALVFWTGLFGVREGDQIALTITDPNGVEFIRRDITQDVTRARQFYFTGRELKGRTIPAGKWTGKVLLHRAGITDQIREFDITVQ